MNNSNANYSSIQLETINVDLFDIKGLIWNGIVNKRFQAVVFVKLLREPKLGISKRREV